MNDQLTRIDGLFRRNQSLDLASIEKVAGGRSRRSLFRDLDGLGCLTSYTHAGRYYTLSYIPQFDEHGLWFCKGIGFSRAGTLKNTLVELIGDAEAGYTHHELRALMHIRVHNTLLSLVHDKRVNREHIEKLYVYVSVQRERAQAQVTRRGECLAAGAKADPLFEVSVLTVIEVLIEVIRAGQVLIDPAEAVQRLRGRGIRVSVSEAEKVFVCYGLSTLKKTPQ
jgi:hypothetical protein